MSDSSVLARVARVHPFIVLPAVGIAAWLVAGLIPGNGAKPAQAMPVRDAAASSRAEPPAALADTLPDRMPDSFSAAMAAPAVAPQASALAPSAGGGNSGSSGGGDGSSGGGSQQKHGGNPGHAGAMQSNGTHRHAQGLAGSHQVTPRTTSNAGSRPRMAYVAPAAPPQRMAAATPLPLPFFGGGHFTPRANFGGGHFGGGGRHR